MRRYLRTAAALCLALCLSLTLFPAPALAAEPLEDVPAPEEPFEESPAQEEAAPAAPEGAEEAPAPEEAEEKPLPEEAGEDPAAEPEAPETAVLVAEPVTVGGDDYFPNLDATAFLGGISLASEEDAGVMPTADTSKYEQLKAEILAGLQARKETITVSNYMGIKGYLSGNNSFTFDSADYQFLVSAYMNAIFGNPETTFDVKSECAISGSASISGSTVSVTEIEFTPVYIRECNKETYTAAVNAAVSECFTASMTDLEKIVAAHDWIAANCQYDPYVGNGRVIEANDITYNNDPMVYTSYGVFVEGNAVCQGYALAMKVLMDRADINCRYASSEAMHHGWNMVQLAGNWYHVDATHDDPVYGVTLSDKTTIKADVPGCIRHEMLLKTDSEAREIDHGSTKYTGWTTEGNCTTPTTGYALPEILKTSSTAVYLDGNTLYHLSGADFAANTVYAYPVGSDFKNSTVVTDQIFKDCNDTGGLAVGLFDRQNRILHYSNCGHLSTLYLDTKEVVYATGQKKGMGAAGLKLVDGKLNFWYAFAPYEQFEIKMPTMQKTETTDATPIAICYYPAASSIASLSRTALALDLGTGGNAGSLYAAVYAADGRLLRLTALASFTSDETGQKSVDGSKINTSGAGSAKLMVVESTRKTPLAAVFESTAD